MTTDVTSTNITSESRIPGGRGGWLTPFDSSRAREMALRRKEKAGRIAREGIQAAGERTPGVGSDYWAMLRKLFEEHTLHALEPGQRGAASSLATVLKWAFPEPEREAGAVAGGSGLTIHMDADTAQRLIDRLRPEPE